MNKRDNLLAFIDGTARPEYVPAAFFLHFDPAFHQGRPAIDKHLEFFRHTGMDLVKIQYEQVLPPVPISAPKDWANVPPYPEEFFEPTLGVVRGLLDATQRQAIVVLTLYSPFMHANNLVKGDVLADHLRQDPEAVARGLEIITENVLKLVRACKRLGIDGFYESTQGGEASRFPGTDIFEKYIKPTDLAVRAETSGCRLNILHICDYSAPYDDLSPFLDYPGHIVNCSLELVNSRLTAKQVSAMFGRPFMGGLERKGVIATGSADEIRAAANRALADAPDRMLLAADCTVPGDTPWDNLKTAIETAHQFRS